MHDENTCAFSGLSVSWTIRLVYEIVEAPRLESMTNDVVFAITLQGVAFKARTQARLTAVIEPTIVFEPINLKWLSGRRPLQYVTCVNIRGLQDRARQIAAGERKEHGADSYCETLDNFHSNTSSKR